MVLRRRADDVSVISPLVRRCWEDIEIGIPELRRVEKSVKGTGHEGT